MVGGEGVGVGDAVEEGGGVGVLLLLLLGVADGGNTRGPLMQ